MQKVIVTAFLTDSSFFLLLRTILFNRIENLTFVWIQNFSCEVIGWTRDKLNFHLSCKAVKIVAQGRIDKFRVSNQHHFNVLLSVPLGSLTTNVCPVSVLVTHHYLNRWSVMKKYHL